MRQLRRCQRHSAIDDRRPNEPALLQPLGDEAQPRAVPVQTFEIVTALAAEDEEVTAEWIGPDHLLHLRRQAVEAVPKIDWAACEEDLGPGRQVDHIEPFIARKTRDNAFSSADQRRRR